MTLGKFVPHSVWDTITYNSTHTLQFTDKMAKNWVQEKTRIFEKVTPTIKVILLLDLFTNYKIISLTEYIFNINKKLFLYKKLQSIDKYYKTFIPKRLSNRWDPAYNIILCHKVYKF